MIRTSLVVFALTIASGAFAATGEVRVPRDIARNRAAPIVARACLIEFDGRTIVGGSCNVPVYRERWEGPVLVVQNLSHRTIWVSYVYESIDGFVYESACQEIPATSERAVTDQSLVPDARRQVRVSMLPGTGYHAQGLRSRCSEVRRLVDAPPEWVDDRWSAAQAERPALVTGSLSDEEN
ncbi:MAG: hypothetical protein AAF533_30700 [Acidobacteriota bacterium]